MLLFSDVGSARTLPLCRRLGIPTVLSMVHGDVREEAQVLEQEAKASPEFFPIYLGDGALDRAELDWLHQRRLRDIALADVILVPSDHIACPGSPRDARPQDPGHSLRGRLPKVPARLEQERPRG